MKGKRTKPMRKRERGLALVEFAIVMPLVALLMFATAELGRALFQYNTLTKAVRDGARYLADHAINAEGVVVGPSDQDIDTAKNLVVFGNPDGEGAHLLPNLFKKDVRGGGESGSFIVCDTVCYVTITADYTFRAAPALDPIPTFGFGDGEGVSIGTRSVTVQMRALR